MYGLPQVNAYGPRGSAGNKMSHDVGIVPTCNRITYGSCHLLSSVNTVDMSFVNVRHALIFSALTRNKRRRVIIATRTS